MSGNKRKLFLRFIKCHSYLVIIWRCNVMKSLKSFCFLLFLYSAVNAQQPGTKTWEQTTTSDFSSGTLTDVVVTDLDGGEVELRPPLILSRNEYTDNGALRFITWHPSGDYFIKPL